jgi:broad specificity phosphatase PhoE
MASKRNYVMLCLIQSGDTPWQREGRLHGASDLPLSDLAREELAARVGTIDHAAFTTVYHPPAESAAETARAFAQRRRAKTKAIDDLADPNLGLLEGLLEEQFAERYTKRYKLWKNDPASLIPPEGEPIEDARTRIFAAVARLLRRARADEIAVVLQPIGLGLLHCRLADRPTTEMRQLLARRRPVERYVVPMSVIEMLPEPVETGAASA